MIIKYQQKEKQNGRGIGQMALKRFRPHGVDRKMAKHYDSVHILLNKFGL